MPRRKIRVTATLLLLVASLARPLSVVRADEGEPSPPPATPASAPLRPRPDAERRVPIGNSAVRGPRDAPVTVTMFGSFRSIPTQHFAAVEMPQVLQAFPTEVNYVMKQYPVARLFRDADEAALALLAAAKQGKFWELYDRFFASVFVDSMPPPDVFARDPKLNLDLDQWARDRTSPEVRAELQANLALVKRLDVKLIPTVFVNDIPQPAFDFQHLKFAIQQQLDGTATPLPALTPPPPRLTATPMPQTSASSLDPRTLSLGQPLKLDDTGYGPNFSPQGDRILYLKSAANGRGMALGAGPANDHSLWIVNVAGGDAHQVVEGARTGSWSPDATKVAYLGEGDGGLSLVDLATGKTYDLLHEDSNYRLFGWAPDGTSIIVGFSERATRRYRIVALALDDLKRTDITTGKEDTATAQGKVRRALQDDPLLDMFYVSHCYWDVIGHAPPRTLSGVWARDLKGSFARLLRDEPIGSVDLAPDHAHVAFGAVSPTAPAVSTGLYIAPLRAIDTLPPRTFRVTLDAAFLAKAFGANTKRCLAAGPLVASAYSPKRNPLNDKIVGAGETWRGNVRLSPPDKTSRATADVVVERTPFGTDSVLHELWVGYLDKPPQKDACVVTLPPDMVAQLQAP